MPATPAEYAAQLEELLADLGGLIRRNGDEMESLLNEARRTILADLAQLDFDSPSRALLDRALAGVNAALRNLGDTLGRQLAATNERAFDTGAAIATAPLGAEFAVVGAGVAENQLALASAFSAELIGSITSDLRKRINGEITSVVVGAKTPQQAATAIGRNLTDPNHFRTIAHRARAIVVTEVGRAQALGTQAAQQALAETQAGLGQPAPRKRWLNAHLPGARATHLKAEADYAPNGPIGPIAIDARYRIAGIEALYPKDPSLPARESVNCHCVSITVLGEASEEALTTGRADDTRDTYAKALGQPA